MLNNLKIKQSIIMLLVICSTLPLIIVGYISYKTASGALQEQAVNQLISVRDIKQQQIESYIQEKINDVTVFTDNLLVVNSLPIFASAFKNGGRTAPEYIQAKAEYGEKFTNYRDAYEYYDLFLIAENGDIVYTVAEEPELGTNLNAGLYRDSNLAQLFRKAKRQADVVDFETHEHSNEPAMFVGAPVKDKDNQLIGVVAFQLPLKEINSIMTNRAGLGDGGESYLVGKDKLWRSDSRFHKDMVLNPNTKVDTVASRKALSGIADVEVIDDYREKPVLSAYRPLHIADLKWVIIAEINKKEAFGAVTSLRNWTSGITFGVICLVVVLGLWFAYSISNPIRQIVNAVQKIGKGDLTQQVNTQAKNEIGQLANGINTMAEDLRYIATQVKEASANITSASSEISTAASQQNASAAEQSAAVSETATTVDEIKQTAESVANNAKSVVETAQHSVGVSKDGQKAVKDAINGVKSIKEQVENIGDSILSLNEKTQYISGIITAVNDIAERSKMLAFNAAIEASKAGEAGKGFSIVASEIRSLAEHSQEEMTHVQVILDAIQKASTDAVMIVEQGTKEADVGVKLAFKAGENIDQLANTIVQAADAMELITMSIDQQNIAIEQISQAMLNIGQATNETVAGTQQAERATLDLNKLATQMTELVGQYTL